MPRTALKIPPGIFSDDTVHAAAGRWADGSNVRFRLAMPQVIGGWEALTADTVDGVCRWIFPWGNNSNQLQFAFGTHTALQVWVGGGLYDITPTADFTAGNIDGAGSAGYGTGAYGMGGYATPTLDDSFPLTWSGGAMGQDLYASPRGQTIFKWDASDTATEAASLSNAPDNVTYCLVSSKDFVFALGCNEEVSTDFNALCVRHSSTFLPNEWATTTTNSAREYILPGGGRIVGGRNLGDYVLVWTNSALFRFDYVGQLTEVYRFEKVGDKCGLIGPNAAVVVGQTAFWISPDRQFWSYSLGGEPTPLPCPIREDFADNLAFAQSDKIVASSIGEFSEIRFDYPDGRDGYENSRYVAVPIAGPDAGAWYRGQMPRTAMVDAGPAPYPLGVQSTVDGDDSEGVPYWHERGQSADGAVLSWFIESADQYLSEDRALLIRSYWPDSEYQVGPMSLTLTSRYRPRGDEVVKAYTVAADADKVDIRASGRLFRMKFAGSASPTAFRMGRPVLDMVPTGGR